jgi:hypothetical protein
MIDVFASSSDLMISALGDLVSNYLVALAVIVPAGFGFFFLWKIINKARKAVS